MLLKKEKFVNDDGHEMVREIYGTNEENITNTIEYAPYDDTNQPINEDTIENHSNDNIDELLAQIMLNQALILSKLEKKEADSDV